MIWSSSDAVAAERGAADARATASDWTWEELAGPDGGPPAGDLAQIEARHAEELEHAYRQGRREGEVAGRAAARQELDSLLTAMRGLLEEMQASRDAWEAELNESLVALSTAVARQIVEREVETEPAIIRELVLKAATSFPRDHCLKVRMHPADLKHLGDGGDGVPPSDAVAGREARWIADEDLARGSYVLEGPERIVDGRVDEALERIYWELTHG